MQIEDFKRWHWMILGLIVGLMFAYMWQDHDVVGDKSYQLAEIKQNVFERDAMSKSRESGQSILQNIKVEPPVKDYMGKSIQIVIGKRLRYSPKDQKEYLVPFYYYAALPYTQHFAVPKAPPLPAGATVLDYLNNAKTANPLLRYRFAWEYQSQWYPVLWGLGGLVVIGGIWPSILRLLIGAGLGRPPKSAEEKENEDYLSRFGKGKKEPQPVLAAKGPTEDDNRRLDEMNNAMESQLAAAGVFATAGAAAASSDDSAVGTPVIKPLTGAPEPAVVAEAAVHQEETEEERHKRFAAGDFYPVARGAKKE
jgi:hypothetical protein